MTETIINRITCTQKQTHPNACKHSKTTMKNQQRHA